MRLFLNTTYCCAPRCSSRDAVDAVVHALASCSGFNIAALVSPLTLLCISLPPAATTAAGTLQRHQLLLQLRVPAAPCHYVLCRLSRGVKPADCFTQYTQRSTMLLLCGAST
jgi:hypothetical protein